MTSMERAFEEIDRYIERRMSEVNIPGVALAVTGREKLLRTAYFGYADLAADRPIQPGTMFEIGSIGKSFTNIALMQLRDEGRLDLQAPVSRYLPWFEVPSGYGPIATHHLMTHTSGPSDRHRYRPPRPLRIVGFAGQPDADASRGVLSLLECGLQDFGFSAGRIGRKTIPRRHSVQGAGPSGYAGLAPGHWARNTKAGRGRLSQIL